MTTPVETSTKSGSPLVKTLIPIVAIVFVVVVVLMLVRSKIHSSNAVHAVGANAPEIAIGKMVPDFALTKLGGGEIKESELKAKVVMINFWATWCEACTVEMPSIVRLQKHYADKGFTVVPINVDENPESVVPATAKKLGIDFQIYIDKDQKLSELYDVHAIPLTVIVDQNRKILFLESGERNWNSDEIHQKIEQWLSG